MEKKVFALKGDLECWDYAMFGVFSTWEETLNAARQIWNNLDDENKPDEHEGCKDGWTGLMAYEVPVDAFQMSEWGFSNKDVTNHCIYREDVE